jgi:hypothetical protein
VGTTIKYLRHTASGAAGNGLGTTPKYLRRTRNGAAGNGLGTTAKYLRGAVVIGLGSTSFCVEPEVPPCVRKQNPHELTLSFSSAAKNNIST